MLSSTKNCYHWQDRNVWQALVGLKILVVDDNLDSLDLISFILETYGVQVQSRLSACKALEVIDTFQPDILISDIAMPEIDGYSLISTIRESKSASQNIPAIAITAMSTQGIVNLTAQAGFQACLIKPFEADDLIKLITFLHLERNKRAVFKVSAA